MHPQEMNTIRSHIQYTNLTLYMLTGLGIPDPQRYLDPGQRLGHPPQPTRVPRSRRG